MYNNLISIAQPLIVLLLNIAFIKINFRYLLSVMTH